MCGIAGIFQYRSDKLVDSGELVQMSESMILRGPDAHGKWLSQDERIGMVHRRLSIIDLSSGASQPMDWGGGELRIVFNGEIYNHKELRVRLEEMGYVFRTHSDTEVLLAMYRQYGKDMVRHLRGMFAFAIWDEKEKGVFLARDHFGIKPLYVSDYDGALRFASQVKTLLCGGVSRALEPAGHVGYFLWGHVPEPYTLYKNIRSLKPGTWMWVSMQGAKLSQTYFSMELELAERCDDPVPKDCDAFIHDLLMNSVTQHLEADVPVGIFLSAGLDSAALVALASERNREIKTFTLGFEEYRGTLADETMLAGQIAKVYGTSHDTRWVKQQDFSREWSRILEKMDQPTIDGVNTYFVSKVVAESGMKVALSGLGGDELFGGYPSFRNVPDVVHRFGFMNTAPLLGKFIRILTAPFITKWTSPKYAGIAEYSTSYGAAYLLRRALFMPWELESLFDRDFLDEGLNKLNTVNMLNADITSLGNEHAIVSILEMKWFMQNQLLRDSDWASMAHSLEVRTPLVDIEVFRGILPLLVKGIQLSKQTMVRNLTPSLPIDVLQRPKTGFSIPVRDWLLAGDATNQKGRARGLRDWSSVVYEHFVGNDRNHLVH